MLKISRYSVFFLMFIYPFVSFSQSCTNFILETTAHLQDNGDGRVTDSKTELIWKKCTEGERWNARSNGCEDDRVRYNWQDALQRAEKVNKGSEGENFGQVDWRIPNIKELASIVELKCIQPSINLSVFSYALYWSSSSYGSYWSSSSYAGGSDSAWSVSFYTGNDYNNHKIYARMFVRLVRSRQ